MSESTSPSSALAQASEPLPPLMPNAALRWDVVSRILPESLGNVLEVGCGQGAVAARLARRARNLTALEPDPQSCSIAKQRVGDRGTVLNLMSQDLPPTDSFDLVCAFEVLEHIEDDHAALADWVSRLRPGGSLMISVPADRRRFGPADEAVGHFRRYDRIDAETLFDQAGLIDVSTQLYGSLGGLILETGRNLLAKRELARGADQMDVEERTATSGRRFQPSSAQSHWLLSSLSYPLVWFQRLFPDRGVGLIAIGRKPK